MIFRYYKSNCRTYIQLNTVAEVSKYLEATFEDIKDDALRHEILRENKIWVSRSLP